eukprot:jgi/Psemu1/21536/gm1.21536_g
MAQTLPPDRSSWVLHQCVWLGRSGWGGLEPLVPLRLDPLQRLFHQRAPANPFYVY